MLYPSVGIRAKTLLLITSVFIGVATLASIEAFRESERLEDDALAEFQWAAKWTASEERRHLTLARMVALIASNRVLAGSVDKMCRQGLVGTPGIDLGLGYLALADADGTVSCNSIPWLHAANVKDEAFFQKALVTNDLAVVRHTSNHIAHRYGGILAHAIRYHGKILGVVLVALDFSWVEKELRLTRLPASGHMLLVDQDGIVIAGSPNVSGWVEKSLVGTPFYEQVLSSPNGYLRGSNLNGDSSLIVAYPFRTGSGTMRVIIDTPYAAIFKPVYQSLMTDLLVSATVFILMLGLVYYWSDRYFIRKIKAIEHEAAALAGGDLSARISGAVDKDELGQLSVSINTMADALQTNERKLTAAIDELYRSNRSLHVLSAGNRSLIKARTEKELLDSVCHEIVEKGSYKAACIGFVGQTAHRYLRIAAAYTKPEEAGDIDWIKQPGIQEMVIATVQEDGILVINDTDQESAHHLLGEQPAKLGYGSLIILPLRLESKPMGALILGANRKQEFGKSQTVFLKETASDISLGIRMLRTAEERDRLRQIAGHHEEMLRDGLEDTIASISLTVETRDPYTAGHQKRVAALAKALARELGMSAEEAHGIFLAGIVHDIGKINVPSEILLKAGALSDAQRTMVNNHPVAGYEILKGIKFPWPVAEIVHQHHERLDGSGYPQGLKGGDILIGSRILAVADVVEAMSSHRPHRPSLGIDAALAEITSGKDTRFDGSVVDACVNLFREGRFSFA
jgi:putative nucleotidyltransferase with HDIG domain